MRPSSFTDSLGKLAHSFRVVAKVDFRLQGKLYVAPPFVRISPKIFRRSWCPVGCAGCCTRFTLDYVPSEAGRPDWINDVRVIECNGYSKGIFTYAQKPGEDGKWKCDNVLPNGYCGIHEHVPLSCDLPLLTFMSPSDVTRPTHIVGKKMSRGWNMTKMDGSKGAVCQIEDSPSDLLIGRDEAVRKFGRMKVWTDYLGIATWLPEIIMWCASGPHDRAASFGDPAYL